MLYRDIDWPALWDRLAEQTEGYRDYQKIKPIARNDGMARDDVDLLTRLFLEAATFGVSDPREQATSGLIELIRAGAPDLFCRTCSQLLEGGHEVQLGARLLFEARDDQAVETKFRHGLEKLTAHEDACVAAIGEILGDVWGTGAYMAAAELPALYSLKLPPLKETPVDHYATKNRWDLLSTIPSLGPKVSISGWRCSPAFPKCLSALSGVALHN